MAPEASKPANPPSRARGSARASRRARLSGSSPRTSTMLPLAPACGAAAAVSELHVHRLHEAGPYLRRTGPRLAPLPRGAENKKWTLAHCCPAAPCCSAGEGVHDTERAGFAALLGAGGRVDTIVRLDSLVGAVGVVTTNADRRRCSLVARRRPRTTSASAWTTRRSPRVDGGHDRTARARGRRVGEREWGHGTRLQLLYYSFTVRRAQLRRRGSSRRPCRRARYRLAAGRVDARAVVALAVAPTLTFSMMRTVTGAGDHLALLTPMTWEARVESASRRRTDRHRDAAVPPFDAPRPRPQLDAQISSSTDSPYIYWRAGAVARQNRRP